MPSIPVVGIHSANSLLDTSPLGRDLRYHEHRQEACLALFPVVIKIVLCNYLGLSSQETKAQSPFLLPCIGIHGSFSFQESLLLVGQVQLGEGCFLHLCLLRLCFVQNNSCGTLAHLGVAYLLWGGTSLSLQQHGL